MASTVSDAIQFFPGSFPHSEAVRVLDSLNAQGNGSVPVDVTFRDEHSNDLIEILFDDGRTLMIKRARLYPESAAQRFATCRLASRMLREQAGVCTPEHLDLPVGERGGEVLAYWRIPLPTLSELWPDLSNRTKPAVLRSLGRLIGRLHQVRYLGAGAPIDALDEPVPLETHLQRDLKDRLLPAAMGEWPQGVRITTRLVEAIPMVAPRVDPQSSVLNHNDLHMSNVLCEINDGRLECVGVLDLEAALIGPAEIDLAKLTIYYGPLFGMPLPSPWFERVWEGYGQPLDPLALAYFRAYHLVNIAFHLAITGNRSHVAAIVAAADEELNAVLA